MQNYSNLQNLTNYVQSSPQFELVPFYLVRVNLPGLQSDTEQISNKGRNKLNLQQTNIEFNTLSFEMLIDENFEIWLEMQKYIRERVSQSHAYDPEDFTFTITVNNNKGNKLFSVVFYDCFITTIGDIQLDSTQDSLHHTLSVDIAYDSYEIVHEHKPIKSEWEKFQDNIKPEIIENDEFLESTEEIPESEILDIKASLE